MSNKIQEVGSDLTFLNVYSDAFAVVRKQCLDSVDEILGPGLQSRRNFHMCARK